MTDLRKAAEMALRVLIEADKGIIPGGIATDIRLIMKEAIKSLRQALANAALDEMVAENQRLGLYDDQPEQEAFYRLLRIMGTFDLATGHADSWDELLDSLESELRDVLGHLRTRREWVGITKEDKKEILEMTQPDERGYVIAITEAKLKEKNT